jgi:outer membrane protein insertion porin family
VDRIYVDGLARTKDDIIISTVKDLFQARDFQEVIVGAHKVRGKLEGLGCFRNIGIFIDTSSGPHATPEGVEVFDFILCRQLELLASQVRLYVLSPYRMAQKLVNC